MKKNNEEHARDAVLEKEAVLFARYLLDSDPPRDMVDRYISANKQLGVNVATAEDERILNFSVSHSWSIPFLDAGAGFLQSEAVLRKKIYTMAAVLEASPRYAENFLPENPSTFMFFFRIITSGLKAFMKVIVGIPMLMLIRKRAND